MIVYATRNYLRSSCIDSFTLIANQSRVLKSKQLQRIKTMARKTAQVKKSDGRVGKRKAGKFRVVELRRDVQYSCRVMSAPTDLQGLISHYGAAHLISLVRAIVEAQPGDLISDGRGCYTKKY
jgi:hypothetical protein